VAIAEGAHFRGSVDMQRKGGSPAPAQLAKPATPAAAPDKAAQQPQRVGV